MWGFVPLFVQSSCVFVLSKSTGLVICIFSGHFDSLIIQPCLVSVIAFSSPRRPGAQLQSFHSLLRFLSIQDLWEYVNYQKSIYFARKHKSGVGLMICAHNIITGVTAVGAWFEGWLHCRSLGGLVLQCICSKAGILFPVATIKLSAGVHSWIWFDCAKDVSFQKHFFLASCLPVIYF